MAVVLSDATYVPEVRAQSCHAFKKPSTMEESVDCKLGSGTRLYTVTNALSPRGKKT